MGVLLAAGWSWLLSPYLASAVALAGAAGFVVWLFLDCSFPGTAEIARHDVCLRFLRDPFLRYRHRWDWYGPRLLIFAILGGLSAAASLAVLIEFAFGAAEQRWTSAVLAIVVVVVWIAIFTMYNGLWWLAFRRRVIRLLPAMKKAAAQLLDEWPETRVFLPGLGNYCPSSREPDHLLHDDRTPVFPFWESVGGISWRKDCRLSFSVASYNRLGARDCPCCCVQYRMHDWSPPEVSVTEVRSPPMTITVRHQYDFALGNSWYLEFYTIKTDLRDEPDPELLAEIAKRPPGTRLPHRGGRFRSLADTPVGVWIEHWEPGRKSSSPLFLEEGTLPQGHVIRLDCEPDPSQSTHCMLMPEDRAALEDRLVDPKEKKDRDYAGYQIQVSYIDLDKNFEWLEIAGEPT